MDDVPIPPMRRQPRAAPRPKRMLPRPQDIAFVEEYLRNGNNITAAYCKVTGKPSGGRTSAAAAQYLRSKRVQRALQDKTMKIQASADYRREHAMAELKEAIDLAKDVRNPSAMVQATKLKSQLAGLLIERHEVSMTRFDDLDTEEREEALRAVQAAIGKARLSSVLS